MTGQVFHRWISAIVLCGEPLENAEGFPGPSRDREGMDIANAAGRGHVLHDGPKSADTRSGLEVIEPGWDAAVWKPRA